MMKGLLSRMRTHIRRATVLAAAAVMAFVTGGGIAAASDSPRHDDQGSGQQVTIKTQKSIALPGVGGHGDVVTVDAAAHAVYIAQSPDNNVIVIDSVHNTIKAVVPNVASANGIAFTNSYVFVASATSNSVKVISKATWKIVASVPSGGGTPDAIYIDSRKNSVFVANDDNSTMEEFSASAPFTVRGSFALPASKTSSTHTGPDLGTYVAAYDRIYQSVDDTVLVINPNNRTVTKTFPLPLPKGSAAKDMYFDPERGLLWVATGSPEVLAINPHTGKVVHTVATLAGADQVTADPAHGLLFLGESKTGTMGVVDLETHRSIASFPVEAGFHTLGYSSQTGVMYTYLNQSNVVHIDRINTNTE
jgi:YVTN family beta-propeller protein